MAGHLLAKCVAFSHNLIPQWHNSFLALKFQKALLKRLKAFKAFRNETCRYVIIFGYPTLNFLQFSLSFRKSLRKTVFKAQVHKRSSLQGVFAVSLLTFVSVSFIQN